MGWAQYFFTGRNRLVTERGGFLQLSLIATYPHEFPHGIQGIWVLRAQDAHEQLERPPIQLFRILELADVAIIDREIVHRDQHVEVFRTELAGLDIQYFAVERRGLGEPSLAAKDFREQHERDQRLGMLRPEN